MRGFSRKLNGQQTGFTLVEMVMIVVVLSILAAVAIPQFGDLSGDAAQGTANGLAGAAAAAAANRSAACKGGLAACGAPLGTCDVSSLMSDLPTGVTWGGTFPGCTVTYKTKSATFKGY